MGSVYARVEKTDIDLIFGKKDNIYINRFHFKTRNMEDSQNDFVPKDIPWEKLPKKTREFSSFMSLVIDETIESMPEKMTPTYIRCFRKGCYGIIETSFDIDADKINWRCTECVNSGVITGIFPSVHVNTCGAHFWLIRNEIEWALFENEIYLR